MINGSPRAPHQASRALETLPGFLGFSSRCYFFIKNPLKTSPEKVAGFSSAPALRLPGCPGRLARDTMILFFKILQKRVLKFKPRGAELSAEFHPPGKSRPLLFPPSAPRQRVPTSAWDVG